MYTIILVHCLWLGTDIIGIAFPGKPIDDWYKDKESLRGAILSAICGGLYGVLLLAGLQAVVNAASALPVNIFDAWQNISGPVMLKTRYPEARFQVLGPPEKGLGSVSMISATRAMATIRKTTKRASYIINLFLADLPHTNASTN